MRIPQLKTTLVANAVFSAVCALILLAAPAQIAGLMGNFPTWISTALGIGLIVFALDVAWIASGLPHSAARSKFIFYADLAWVIATLPAILIFATYLSSWGILLLIDLAIVIALLAWLEWKGLQKLAQPALNGR